MQFGPLFSTRITRWIFPWEQESNMLIPTCIKINSEDVSGLWLLLIRLQPRGTINKIFMAEFGAGENRRAKGAAFGMIWLAILETRPKIESQKLEMLGKTTTSGGRRLSLSIHPFQALRIHMHGVPFPLMPLHETFIEHVIVGTSICPCILSRLCPGLWHPKSWQGWAIVGKQILVSRYWDTYNA